MKRYPLKLTLCFIVFFSSPVFAQRFLSEIFPAATIISDVIYGNNFSVLLGTPTAEDLKMDVYEPGGMPDPLLQRPLIVLMHTGGFLPTYLNQTPTGSRHDSAMVAICTRLAKRGYVVAAMSYRLGWNPAATGGGPNEDIRRGTFFTAIYRAMQDAKACVRFFRKDAATTNVFKIDPNKIILGGAGSGGYVALAYATLNTPFEIALPKFLSDNTVGAPYNYISGQPYINQAMQGDYDGYGGNATLNNPNNSVGYPNNVQFVFNMGGALCDSTWIAAGDAPMVAFHVTGDPFAPYGYGIVTVPATSDTVLGVSGSRDVIRIADQLGNNNCFINAGFTDVYTQHANTLNNGFDGLYPFATIPSVQSAPWEWFDSLATIAACQATGQSSSQCAAIYSNAILTNPNMSKIKALAYIDTVMKYLNPRIVYCLNLPTGIHENQQWNAAVNIYPNPATTEIFVNSSLVNELISDIEITDVTGKTVRKIEKINNSFYRVKRENISAGIYFVKVRTNKSESIAKISLK